MRARRAQPPVLARLLLRALAPGRDHDELAGDLHELFAVRAARDGRRAARRWYWRQVARAWFDLAPARRPVIARSMAGDPVMLTLVQDARYALRMLRKQPSFTTVAVLLLALGIGANATIFSWTNAVLLDPIPGAGHEDELVQLSYTFRGDGVPSFSYPDLQDLRAQARSLVGIAGRDELSLGVVIDREAERVWAEIATGNFFDVLGVQAWRGRVLQPSDDAPGAPAVAVLAHDYWLARFGGGDDAIGRQIQINAQPFTIVGVAPPGFVGGSTGLKFDLWVPVATHAALTGGSSRLEARGARWLMLLARRAPGVSIEQVRAELPAILERFKQEHQGYEEVGLTAFPLSESPSGGVSVLRTVLLVLTATAAIVLLIACANLAGLLAARAAARQREMSIRLAIGADRRRLVQQLIVEGFLLALAGTAAALVALRWTSGLLLGFAPPSELPIHLAVDVDMRVVLFTSGVALSTVVLFALLPALHATRGGALAGLRESAGTGRAFARSRLRRGLVMAQVAMSIALLVGAGLCVRSLQMARTVTPGFDAEGVAVGWIDLLAARYTPDEGRAYYARLLDRVRELPGVESASLAGHIPLGFIGGSTVNATIEGRVANPNEQIVVGFNRVAPDYLQTMRIPLRAGRDIAASDVRDRPLVAVIGETMAKRYWPDGDALGQRFHFGRPVEGRTPDYITVVGIAGDIKRRSMNEPPQNVVYVPLQQYYAADSMLHVRAAGDLTPILSDLPRAVRELDPNVPFYGVGRLAQHTRAATFQQELAANLLVVFGGLALLLAAIGSYGVLSYLVGQRRREIGIRLAVGASRASVFKLVAASGAKLIAIGAAAGLALSLGVGMALRSLLIGVQPIDPPTYAAVVLLMAVVALAACTLPARRAAIIDPAATLRED